MKEKPNQVTIYSNGEFFGNINKYEGTLIEQGTRKYAQYNNAPFVRFVPKRKRLGRVIQKTSYPYLLILDGVGHPEPPSMYGEAIATPVATVKASVYSSFDDRWNTDFDAIIDRYITESGVRVIGDYRTTKGFNSYSKVVLPPIQEEYDQEANDRYDDPSPIEKPQTIEDIKKAVMKEIGDRGTCVGGMALKYGGRVVAEQIAQGSLTNYEYFKRVKEFMINKQGAFASGFIIDEGWID